VEVQTNAGAFLTPDYRTTADSLMYKPGMGTADLAAIPMMKSSQLRKLSEAAASGGADERIWAAISARCEASAETLNYWDSVLILQSFCAARVEHHGTLLRLGEALCSKMSRLAPKHVLDLFAVYEAFGYRPRVVYVELFHTLIRLSRSMYAEEIALSLQAMARYQLGNPTVISHLVRTISKQLGEFRLRYLCTVAGALGLLQACTEDFMVKIDQRARYEVETVAIQELLENLQAFPRLEFSWRPYEDMCLQEFHARTLTFVTAEDMDQLVAPFEAMAFLQAQSLLHEEFLKSLCQWCLRGVHRPNVRSERRPTTKQLVVLHDVCREWGLEDDAALQDAILFFVESAGGKWPITNPPPLRFRRKRVYIRTTDPLAGILPAEGLVPQASTPARVGKDSENLPGILGLPEVQLETASEGNQLAVGGGDMAPPRQYKVSKGETVSCWITSRRSPRPRVRRDIGKMRLLNKERGRAPIWWQGGWEMTPKYQQGVATKRYPYAGKAIGNRGTARVMRK